MSHPAGSVDAGFPSLRRGRIGTLGFIGPPKRNAVNLATRLAPIELLDASTGETVQLASLWEKTPAVLIFLRHFG